MWAPPAQGPKGPGLPQATSASAPRGARAGPWAGDGTGRKAFSPKVWPKVFPTAPSGPRGWPNPCSPGSGTSASPASPRPGAGPRGRGWWWPCPTPGSSGATPTCRGPSSPGWTSRRRAFPPGGRPGPPLPPPGLPGQQRQRPPRPLGAPGGGGGPGPGPGCGARGALNPFSSSLPFFHHPPPQQPSPRAGKSPFFFTREVCGAGGGVGNGVKRKEEGEVGKFWLHALGGGGVCG